MPQQKNTTLSNQDVPICPYCQRRFSSLDQLTLHIVTRHTRSGKQKDQAPAQAGGKS